MPFKVKYTSTLEGDIGLLEVRIQNELVANDSENKYKVDVTEDYSEHGLLIVQYKVGGLNGTGFTITYTCKSAAASCSDPDNPSPVSGVIRRNGIAIVTLKIPV